MSGSGVKNHITVYISDEDAKVLKRVKKRLGNKFSISGEARKAIVRAAEKALGSSSKSTVEEIDDVFAEEEKKEKKKTLRRGALRK